MNIRMYACTYIYYPFSSSYCVCMYVVGVWVVNSGIEFRKPSRNSYSSAVVSAHDADQNADLEEMMPDLTSLFLSETSSSDDLIETVCIDLTVAILSTGQLFGEACKLDTILTFIHL